MKNIIVGHIGSRKLVVGNKNSFKKNYIVITNDIFKKIITGKPFEVNYNSTSASTTTSTSVDVLSIEEEIKNIILDDIQDGTVLTDAELGVE